MARFDFVKFFTSLVCLCICRGPPGDLYVFLSVNEMPGIVREGTNLFSNITIDYTDAILGTVAQVILFSLTVL